MTRRVVPSNEVFHLWAYQSQDEARNSLDSVSFHGKTAYSYATPIGMIVDNIRGERGWLVGTRHYSNTTTKHQSWMRQAIPSSARNVFHVKEAAKGGWNHEDNDHAARLTEYAERIELYERKAKRARFADNRDHWLGEAQETREEANRYCQFFDLAPAFDSETVARLRAEREAAIARANAAAAEAQRRRDDEYRARFAEEADSWRAGAHNLIHYHPDVLLRVNPDDPAEVETSKGARVPLRHARRLLDAWRAGSLTVGQKIGVYQLDEINGAEALQIGCHYITRAEAERFAASQGWDTPAPAELQECGA